MIIQQYQPHFHVITSAKPVWMFFHSPSNAGKQAGKIEQVSVKKKRKPGFCRTKIVWLNLCRYFWYPQTLALEFWKRLWNLETWSHQILQFHRCLEPCNFGTSRRKTSPSNGRFNVTLAWCELNCDVPIVRSSPVTQDIYSCRRPATLPGSRKRPPLLRVRALRFKM